VYGFCFIHLAGITVTLAVLPNIKTRKNSAGSTDFQSSLYEYSIDTAFHFRQNDGRLIYITHCYHINKKQKKNLLTRCNPEAITLFGGSPGVPAVNSPCPRNML
jgi:hypothetical protein